MSRKTEGRYPKSTRSAVICAMLFVTSGTSANDVPDLYEYDYPAPKKPAASMQGTASNERGSGTPLHRWFAKTPDGRVETGWTRDGVREGEWTIQWPDGLSESGRYTEGKRTGEWTVMHPDGRTEKGDYDDGLRHGLWTIGPIDSFGTHSYQLFSPPDDFSYGQVTAERLFSLGTAVGPWVVRNGQGIWAIWSAEGNHIDERGRLQGQWKVRWVDGTTARGLMFDSAQHGEWEVRNSIGTHARGAYCNGVRCGHWTIRWYDGVREQGSYCARGVKCRGWQIFWPDGTYEQGPYDKGRRHGKWKIVLPGGILEQGPYEHGQRHGRWKVEWPDGTSESGAFDKGKRSGSWVFRQGDDEATGRYEEGQNVGDWIYRFRLRQMKRENEAIAKRCGKIEWEMCASYTTVVLEMGSKTWDMTIGQQKGEAEYEGLKKGNGFITERSTLWISYFEDGGFDTGPIITNRRNGHWKRWDPDGTLLEGRYINGVSQGRWRTRFPDGTVSNGEVGNHHRPHGLWQIRDPAGTVRQGLYIAGREEGLWETVPLDRGSWGVWMKADEEPPIQWR